MRITIKDIARESGFSIATVSKVLNNKDSEISEPTKEIILKIADQLNYQTNRAARSLVSNSTKTIGLLLPDISNPFFSDIAKGAEDFAYKKGYSIILCNSDDIIEKELDYLNTLIQLNVDGILLVGNKKHNNIKSTSLIFDQPIVSIDRESNYTNILSVIKTDHYNGAKEAMNYLIKNGHKKILFIGGQEDTVPAIERFNAYKDSMETHKLKYNLNDIYFKDFSTEHGYNTILKIKNIKKYSAIFCCNDLIAIGAMAALKDIGLNIPNDISLIGVDDIELSKISSPPLTTMKQSAYKLGSKSCEILLKKLNNNIEITNITLTQKLVVRKSVKKIKT
ncbi:LacI family DNA-binding transcriptional regulator [Helcococcus kunzii]|uniref:LacI family DNA-binding transcriptional regulator n=1 Tax=Helcococcus kunzii TaxID=40091 RepID=UPI0024ACABAA|nr:LacI family DNA-binding transcriptional regulator [Helcococcus kunzii]